MKRLRLGFISVMVTLLLLICSCSSGTVVDYGDAQAFEDALNRGENLQNKTLMFTVTELHPDSVLGFNVCGGEHLNFISSKNPDLKVGATAGVKALDISSALGSWIIKYELIKNPVKGEKTIVSTGKNESKDSTSEQNTTPEVETTTTTTFSQNQSNVSIPSNNKYDTKHINSSNSSDSSQEKHNLELVDYNILTFNDYQGPRVSSYVAYKNLSDRTVEIYNQRMDYEDNNGKLIATDQNAKCIPSVVKPGQIFYLYSYHFSLNGIDTSNGLAYRPDCQFRAPSNFIELKVNDTNYQPNGLSGFKIFARATNDTGKEHHVNPGAILFDKNNKVVGFCTTLASFPAGQTLSFDMSSQMISSEIDPSIVDHLEVYIQENSF